MKGKVLDIIIQNLKLLATMKRRIHFTMPRAPSHSSGGSTPPHPHHLRYLQRSYDIKVDIPEFVWKMQPDNFIDWLTTIEWVFNFKDVPNNCKVKIVAIKLRKHASIWWEHLKRQRQREGRDHIVTWEKMKRELKKKYLPDHFKQNAFLRFHNFKKKELSVEEYISKFDLLMTRCDIVEPKEQMIAYYLGGLCVELSDVVQLQTFEPTMMFASFLWKWRNNWRKGMVVTFDPIIERVFLIEEMVPLQRLLHYPRQPLSSNHQRMNPHQVLIIPTSLVQAIDVSNVKALRIYCFWLSKSQDSFSSGGRCGDRRWGWINTGCSWTYCLRWGGGLCYPRRGACSSKKS